MAKRLGLAIAILLAGTAGALAHTAERGNLQVVHPWVEPAAAGADTLAHPTVVNNGSKALAITRATSPVAQEIQMLHRGQPAAEVTVAPGQTVTPEQFRLRLKGLRVALPEGKAVPITLHLRGMAPMQMHMAIGQSTMNPDQVVQMPHGHSGDGHQGGSDRGSHAEGARHGAD